MSSVKLTDARQKALDARMQVEEAQKVMADSIKTAITEGFEVLFSEYPFLGSVSWTQYTPYFNDGDPCVFSSSITYPSINSVKDTEDETEGSHEENGSDFASHGDEQEYLGYDQETRTSRYEPNANYNPRYRECESAVIEFMKSLAGDNDRSYHDSTPSTFDSALLRAFGDHTTITVTRDHIELGECDHD